MEGTHPFRPERKRGPTPILKPVVEHSHADFRSITGGFVYHGKRLPELAGAYIYGDYDTGRIWTFKFDAKEKKVTEHRELADTTLRIVAWGEDAEGEIVRARFHRRRHLSPRKGSAGSGLELPRKLSETGVFASTKDHLPARA